MMAACLMASADGDPVLSAGIKRLASPACLAQAAAKGLAIRLCRRLTALSPLALANSALRVDGSQLILSLEEPFGALYSEGVEKDLRNLAGRLGLTYGVAKGTTGIVNSAASATGSNEPD